MTGYKVTHNTTRSVLVNWTSNTTFTVESVGTGIYLFTVLAINVVGDGAEESVTGKGSTSGFMFQMTQLDLVLPTVEKSGKKSRAGKLN